MTLSRLIAAPTFVIIAFAIMGGLAGCSSDHGRGMEHHMMNADYTPSGNYMRATSAGQIMTTPEGMTVYTYDEDGPGVSSCYGGCADEWSPVTAAADAQPFGEMSIIERTDGKRQWAYDSKPLYTYDDDDKPGDAEGNGEDGVWHVVK